MSIFFDKKLFLYLISGFIGFTIIGTMSHECGHYFTAEFLGDEASMNYAFTDFKEDLSRQDEIMTIAGGVLQTLITGTIGFILLVFYRESFYKATQLNFKQWVLIFISLFWLRELFNFLMGLLIYLRSGSLPGQNDEVRLAINLNYYPLTFSFPLALLATGILFFVIFKIIPFKQRFTFVMSLGIGGPLGYFCWMKVLGPLILP